jgi:hypothetical protein
MALNNLTGQNIQDTYQKVVQTDGTNLADGTGSLLPISFNGNDVIISGSLTAHQYIVSSSVTNITIATLSGSTEFGDTTDDTHTFIGHITASGNISASGNIDSNKFQAYNNGLSGSYLTSNKIVVHESDSNIEAFSVVASATKASLLMRSSGNLRIYLDPVNNSYIWTNGNFGIGDATPSYKLDVAGTGRFTSALLVNSNVTGLGNSSFGAPSPGGNLHQHLFTGNITASDNISASGNLQGANFHAFNDVTRVGATAGYNNTGDSQTAIGVLAGNSNQGDSQTVLGYGAGDGNLGDSQTAIGYRAGKGNLGDSQTAIGLSAGSPNTGNYQTAIGFEAGAGNSGHNQVAIGYGAGLSNTLDNQFIVKHSQASATPLIQGNFRSGSIGIGIALPQANLHVVGNILATTNITASANISASGNLQGANFHAFNDITRVGASAGSGNTGTYQTVVGKFTGYNNFGHYQTAIGYAAGYGNEGDNQTAVGYGSGHSNSGNNLVAIGYQAGLSNTLDNQFIVRHKLASATPLIQGNFESGSIGIGLALPQANLHVVGNILATTNITASANISASGTITANNINGTINGGTF